MKYEPQLIIIEQGTLSGAKAPIEIVLSIPEVDDKGNYSNGMCYLRSPKAKREAPEYLLKLGEALNKMIADHWREYIEDHREY